MEMLSVYKKYIESKPYNNIVIKGRNNNNVLDVVLHRMLNLVNNFSYEENDNILFVDKNEREVQVAKDKYASIEKENKYEYYSLLYNDVKPEFISYSKLIKKYVSEYSIVSNKEKVDILNNLIKNGDYKRCKKIKTENIYLILNEIKYMKNNNIFSLDKYMELTKAPLKLRKNSYSRNEMFELFEAYNKELIKRNFVDEEDLVIKAISKIDINKYSHIFINNAQDYSKIELDFLLKLSKNKSFGTTNLYINLDKGENIYSNLVSKGRIYLKRNFGSDKKLFNFITNKKDQKQKENKIIEDKYLYMDLKHRINYEFYLDNDENEVIYGADNERYDKEEVDNIPVFNNIAAGEPILINPMQEDVFNIPKYWIRGNNSKFILKVKGNSMINANINNGDLVVIEKNPSPSNGDIIAVNIDGNATLKRLKIEKNKILLMPENESYEPIIINEDEEFFVLGSAIGVIKRN